MAQISDLVIQLEMQSAQFQTQMARVNSQLGTLDRRTKQSSASMANFGASLKRAVGPLAAVFAAQKIISGIGQLVDGMDDIAKAAPKIGLTTAALQELQFAAGLAGVDAKGLQTAMQRLSVNMLDAGRGVVEMEQAFKALGVAGEKDASKVLGVIADRFAKMPDGAQKTAEAIKLFGRSGAALIPLLNEGSAGLAAYKKEAEELGIVIDEKTLKASEALNDNISRLTAVATVFATRFLSPIIEGLVEMTKGFIEATKEGRTFFGILESGLQKMLGSGLDVRIAEISTALKGLYAEREQYYRNSQPVDDYLAYQIEKLEFDLIELEKRKNAVSLTPIVITAELPDTKPLFTSTTKITNALKAEADAITKNIDVVGEYTRQIERLNLMKEKGYITDNIYEEKLFQLQDGLSAAATSTADLADKTVSLSEEMKVAAGNLISGAISGLVDVIFEANQSFSKFAANFLKEIAKMITQVIIFNAIKNSSFGEWLGIGKNADGNSYPGGTSLPQGVYTTPHLFKFANGGAFTGSRLGLMGEAGPEAILPLKRGSDGKLGVAGGGGGVSVVINNNAPVEVSASQNQGPDGQMVLSLQIEKKVKDMFASGNMDRAMRMSYGLSRQPA